MEMKVKMLLAPHPLLTAFQEILNIEFALEHAPTSETEQSDLRQRLAELKAQPRKN